ncbi:unnamed protein product [Brassicogethes aeneus]|uniref:Uncharacterized protein n=1 Tax=Brassicogethes aeneus TaxID=1431903 RepID=A0A9P0FP25_BRAAE|nr:unnamed protein product [Brassicogethes aeneus]
MPVPTEEHLTEDEWDTIDHQLSDYEDDLQDKSLLESEWNKILDNWNWYYCEPNNSYFRDFEDQLNYYRRFRNIWKLFVVLQDISDWNYLKMTTQEILCEDLEEASQVLQLLELHWTEETSILCLHVLMRTLIATAIELKDLTAKKMWVTIATTMKKIMKVMKKQDVPLNSPISFEKFTDLLKNEELYMKLYTLKAKKTAIDMLESALKRDQWQTSNCSFGTETTFMSSTTAPSAIPSASVVDTNNCGATVDSLEKLFGISDFESNTGTISCFIQKKKNDSLFSLNVESPSGFEVVKLEVYPSTDIMDLPKQEWWRYAKTKAIFAIPSPVDPLKMAVDRLTVMAGKALKENPQCKMERKKTSSSRGFGNNRQAPY